ncbi:hypothetical protein GW17_00006199, partial [Ensete ventricosum]
LGAGPDADGLGEAGWGPCGVRRGGGGGKGGDDVEEGGDAGRVFRPRAGGLLHGDMKTHRKDYGHEEQICDPEETIALEPEAPFFRSRRGRMTNGAFRVFNGCFDYSCAKRRQILSCFATAKKFPRHPYAPTFAILLSFPAS